MTSHDPLTCTECNPAPWAQAELHYRGHARRITGWAVVAVVFVPFTVVVFGLGLVVGLAIAGRL